MGRQAGLLIAVMAAAVSGAAVAHAAAKATPIHVSLKFPKACTGVVYRAKVTPAGSVAGISVRNAAAGNALPAEIRAVAAVATLGKQVYIWVFMNNLAPRRVSAFTDKESALDLIFRGANHIAGFTPLDEIHAAETQIVNMNEVMTVKTWERLGNFTSPPAAVAKFSAAPASDKSAHCG